MGHLWIWKRTYLWGSWTPTWFASRTAQQVKMCERSYKTIYINRIKTRMNFVGEFSEVLNDLWALKPHRARPLKCLVHLSIFYQPNSLKLRERPKALAVLVSSAVLLGHMVDLGWLGLGLFVFPCLWRALLSSECTEWTSCLPSRSSICIAGIFAFDT